MAYEIIEDLDTKVSLLFKTYGLGGEHNRND